MKGLLKVIIIFLITGLWNSSLAFPGLEFKFNGNLTGRECLNHDHGEHLPFPGDCTKYLVCEYFSGTVMPCPSGHHFNAALKVCSSPTSPSLNGSSPLQISTEFAITPEIVPTLMPDDILCNGKANGTLSPYPYDCDWYIRCEDFASIVLHCEEGRQFNAVLLICDYPENALCIATPYPTPTTESTTEQITDSTTISTSPATEPTTDLTKIPETSETVSTESQTTPESVPTLMPDDIICNGKANGTLSPYPYDCDWYIRCEDFASIVLRCEGGRQFNAILLICDYPENAQCIATPYPTPTTESTTEQITDSTTISTSPAIEPTTDLTTTIPETSETGSTEPQTTPESVPTLMPDDIICNGKANGTLSPHPYDCDWYIRCEDFASIVLHCEEGRQFNAVLLICDYPENALCIATPYPTPTTESTTEQITDSTTISTSPATEPTTDLTKIPETSETVSTESQTTPESVPTLMPDDIICNGKANGTLSPYPYDCDWYIRCEDFASIVLRCEGGRQFNAILLICDYPENAQCIATPYPTPTTESTTEQITDSTTISTSPAIEPTTDLTTTIPETSETVSTEPQTTPESVPTLMPDDIICNGKANGTLSPYPYDCDWYIRCEDFASIVLHCEEGRQFNAVLLICDYPENALCIATPYPTPTTESTTEQITDSTTISTSPATEPTTDLTKIPETSETVSTESQTTPESVPTLMPDDIICNGKANGTLSPYPYDCDWYIRCEDFASIVLRCEGGRQFNAILLICDYPENAQCIATPYPTPTTESTTEQITDSTTISTSPAIEPTTDLTTTIPETSETVSTEPQTTPESVPTLMPDDIICNGKANGTLSPYPYDCDWYIRCEDFASIVLHCEEGRQFNAVLLICDYPENALCIATPYPTPTTESTTEQITDSTTISTSPATEPTTDLTKIPETSETVSTESQTTPEPVPTLMPDDIICNGKANGTLSPYPYDCDWYIRCEDFASIVLHCEEGRQFNAVLLICDYPENALCIATPYPTPTTESTTEQITDSTTISTSPATEQTTDLTTTIPETSETVSTESQTTPESVPTMMPDDIICNGKANGTLSPYPYDCDWYIRCEDFASIVLHCEEGRQFNAILLICDYPENAQCIATPYPTPTTEPITEPITEPSTIPASPTIDPIPTIEPGLEFCIDQPNNTLFEYPWDCTLYIRCENNNAQVEPCKDGRVFNSVLKICDFPENTECKEEPFPSTGTPTDPSVEPSTSTTTLGPGQGSTNPPYVGTGICENIERGTLLPYPGRCDLYIKCIEPAPTAFSCPSDLEFNPEERQCQKIEEAGCSIPKVTPEITTTTEATKPLPPIYSGICSTYPEGDLIPYPGNCSQYINCNTPIPTAEECPMDLEFNANLQICESVQDAGCSCSPIQTPNTPEPPTTPSTPSEGTAICKDLEDGELVAYPGDCNKFIICEQPIPTADKCGDGLIFNSDMGICDEPSDAECVASTLPPQIEYPGDPAITGICKGHQNGDLIAYPDSCVKYIRCLTPVPVAVSCKDGLLFNEVLGICDTSDGVDCPGYTPTPKPGEGTTTEPPVSTNSTNGVCQGHKPGDLIPYPGQCRKFIQCGVPVPYAKTCENDFHFNANLSICDDPETAECETVIPTPQPPLSGSNVCCGAENGSLVAFPDDCTQYIQCIYPIPISLQCENGLHFNSNSQKCESIESAACQWYTTTTIAPVTCEDEEDGAVFAYSEDCKKYYYCSEGLPVLLPCTIGSIFDENSGNCVQGDICMSKK